MSEPLVLPFPPPDGVELKKAYRNLYLSANGTEADKKRIGNPANLPRPWDPASCTNPALRRELWAWLEGFVIWFNHEYVWDHNAGMIPACWPQHPHLVHEIAVLADQRRRASIDTSSNLLEEWHRYAATAFLQRLHLRVKAHCDECHQPVPARARQLRYAASAARTARTLAFESDTPGGATESAPRGQRRPCSAAGELFGSTRH